MKVVVEVDRFFRHARVYTPITIRGIAAKVRQPIDRRYRG
jgi:hypothetical protein